VFRLGWQVLRERIGEVVDPARARRAAWVSAAITLAVLVALVVLQLRFGWAGDDVVRAAVALPLMAVGSGLVLFSCFPTARPVDPAATINGRQIRPDSILSTRWSVQPYLGRRARPVDPADRDAVLHDTPLLQRGLLGRLSRFGPFSAGLALGVVGAIVVGGFHTVPLASSAVWVASLPDVVVRLGRAERARLAALATDPVAPAAAPLGWRRDPRGSKIRLPGE
jgi:hypothetical protein